MIELKRFAAQKVYSMDEKPGDVLTIEELSAYLKISKSTLYKLVREGRIPSQKVDVTGGFEKKPSTGGWRKRGWKNLHLKGVRNG